ncbi:unnamed protein product [Brachionus calyciflorus]|uniref:Reverse transcriptase RNase H-like domain-containing protein n=1 Tax=Brachionus calyciflorus TaxID=104777 RepID=A0A814GCN2_9BILA|nr:unnamed protein product [Brachionus calyciflorus]
MGLIKVFWTEIDENNLTITEKKCLSIIFGIKELRIYLHGIKFTIVVDHWALVCLKSIKDPSANLTRWILLLQDFDFEVIHRKGSQHCIADALSRPVIDYIFTISNLTLQEDKEIKENCWKFLNPIPERTK